MTPEAFAALADQGYNRIPVVCEVLADLDTPLSVYLKLVDRPLGYLLESVHGGEKLGRYSIIGLPCHTVVRIYGDRIETRVDGELVDELQSADPLGWIDAFRERYKVPDLEYLPRFQAGEDDE